MKKNPIVLLVILFTCMAIPLRAQYHESVFPELQGSILLEQLVEHYKPASVLDYDAAREAMYRYIYNVNDSVTCVYTGRTLYLPPDVNSPIFHLSMFGSPNGIITEHTYPRSKGADEGNALSDMHHLVPARLSANIARNNFPFTDIPDEETDLWMYNTQTLYSMPAFGKALYSEQVIGRFEPREDHKGNVARAVFYFYTMYRLQAQAADPDFFDEQRSTLCEWHYYDPVDEKEWERTFQIAEYQDGRPNPFVLDCSLAARTYCEDAAQECLATSVESVHAPGENPLQLFPNPSSGIATLSFGLRHTRHVRLAVYDLLGREVLLLHDGELSPGAYRFPVRIREGTARQLFICRLVFSGDSGSEQFQRKWVVE